MAPARPSHAANAALTFQPDHWLWAGHYHEIPDDLTSADVYLGRGQRILDRRNEIRKILSRCADANTSKSMHEANTNGLEDLLDQMLVGPENFDHGHSQGE